MQTIVTLAELKRQIAKHAAAGGSEEAFRLVPDSAMAEYLLSITGGERPETEKLRERKANQYAEDMLQHRWTFGESVCVNNEGKYDNGHCRMHAVTIAMRRRRNLRIPFLLVIGTDPDHIRNTDSGRGLSNSARVTMIASRGRRYNGKAVLPESKSLGTLLTNLLNPTRHADLQVNRHDHLNFWQLYGTTLEEYNKTFARYCKQELRRPQAIAATVRASYHLDKSLVLACIQQLGNPLQPPKTNPMYNFWMLRRRLLAIRGLTNKMEKITLSERNELLNPLGYDADNRRSVYFATEYAFEKTEAGQVIDPRGYAKSVAELFPLPHEREKQLAIAADVG